MNTPEKQNFNLTTLSAKTGLFNLIFGFIVGIGGFIGYISAKSAVSLASGITFGNLLILAYWGTGINKKTNTERKWGFYLGAVLSVVLLIFFIKRFLTTGKPMPAFVIIGFSVIGIVLNCYKLHLFSLEKLEK